MIGQFLENSQYSTDKNLGMVYINGKLICIAKENKNKVFEINPTTFSETAVLENAMVYEETQGSERQVLAESLFTDGIYLYVVALKITK